MPGLYLIEIDQGDQVLGGFFAPRARTGARPPNLRRHCRIGERFTKDTWVDAS